MENSFATIKDTSYSYRIQLSMPFHSYDLSYSYDFPILWIKGALTD
jgi:hypothetical protein